MFSLTFRHDGHVTKNTYRFEEIDTDTNKVKEKGEWIIGKIYIQKISFPSMCPDEIIVEVEW